MEMKAIKNYLQEKLLGIEIENMLTFEPHVGNLCKKAGQKLHAVARVANYMNISKKRIHLFTSLILSTDMDVSQ